MPFSDPVQFEISNLIDTRVQVGAAVVFLYSASIFGSTTSPLAVCNSGARIIFDSSIASTSSSFISLDNGSTYASKATIEAGTNKTVFNTSTGAMVQEQ